MSRNLRTDPKTPNSFKRKGARPRPFLALLFVIATVLFALSLIDYKSTQTGRFDTAIETRNMIGNFGSEFGYHTLYWVGMANWLLPLLTAWVAYLYFRSLGYTINLRKIASLFILLTAASVFLRVWQMEFMEGRIFPNDSNYYPFAMEGPVGEGLNGSMGGWLGAMIYDGSLQNLFGMVGTMVVFGILAIFSLWFIVQDNLAVDLKAFFIGRAERWAVLSEEMKKRRAEKASIKKANRQAAMASKKAKKQIEAAKKQAEREAYERAQMDSQASAPGPKKKGGLFAFASLNKDNELEDTPSGPIVNPKPFEPLVEGPDDVPSSRPAAPRSVAQSSRTSGSAVATEEAPPVPSSALKLTRPGGEAAPAGLRIIASEPTKKASIKLPTKRGDYVFPGMNLLAEPPPVGEEDNETAHQETAEALVQTLEEFGVKVTMGEVHAGPVITRYDVYPAPGVRVERIVNLDKNLALGLKALSVRILAPVPGKGCVGIEVPNRKAQPVFIRDILESEDWVNTKAEIPIALGKEVSGKPLVADLTKMPHLLIAGSTGAGKTVCINAIITSLLYHSSPEDIRFVMVDPKIVEMQVYNNLPHMLIPVVTDPKKVPNALKHLLNEMERRYQIFASVGVRNIAGYNAKMARNREDRNAAEERAAELDADLTPEERAAAANAISVPRDPSVEGELPPRLPYIVCIVDELADLMMVAPADIETGIARLAQLARAAGIHLILATQRPSVNVITGVIKANLPSRIAFKVASKVDSRTILDTGGADQLIGKGDMLFLPPGSADLIRSQGAFVDDDEINGIVEFVKQNNGEPEFDENFQRSVELGSDDDDGSGGDDGNWDDDLVPDAIEVIRTSKRASTSMLQRRLKIGYNRAARIMEILEAEGIVGPENGSSPREILKEMD